LKVKQIAAYHLNCLFKENMKFFMRKKWKPTNSIVRKLRQKVYQKIKISEEN